MHSILLNLLEDIMFDMPDVVRCRQFADYVVDNIILLRKTVIFADTVGVCMHLI